MIDLRGSVRIGSLCSGYGGLDAGVEQVFPDASVAWFVEYDKDPSKILAHHWPEVPNHGDVKTTDWGAVEPIDILTAGYPCQPFSHAGKRKGTDDPRHLWPGVARAIGALRPRLVVLENVAGHVSLGLADVLGDLSALGYDATWGVVRASDAGAPHGRARIFIVATDPEGDTRRFIDGDARPAAADADDDGRSQGNAGRPAAEQPRPAGYRAAADAGRERHGRGQDAGGVGRLDAVDAGAPRERERPRALAGDRGDAATADAAGERRGEGWAEPARRIGRPAPVLSGATAADAEGFGRTGCFEPRPDVVGDGSQPAHTGEVGRTWFGQYEPAIRRWEAVIGRPAPAPTEPGRDDRPRLSPRFVEWLMGLDAGHVTDVPGLSRNAQLKALGNGVVPQQAALAIRTLLDQVQILDPEAVAR